LSITYFETGYFEDAIFAAKGALALQLGGQVEVYLTIYERMIVAYMHSHNYKTAMEKLKECCPPSLFPRLKSTIRQAEEIDAVFADAKLARDRIIMNLPRYKPTV
jgi:hypothetical protein